MGVYDTMLLQAILTKSEEIEKEMAAIASLLRRLPEIQAAALLTMQEEQQKAALQGKGAADLWVIPPPDQR